MLGNMNKSKLTIGLLTTLLSVGALAACSEVKYNKDGVILTYTKDGKTFGSYTAGDLLNDELDKNQQTVFDATYKMVVKSYFTEEDPDDPNLGKKEYSELYNKAVKKVDSDKLEAQKAADKNGTSYSTEFDAILARMNCENEEELRDAYLYQYEKERFEENVEKNNLRIMKEGTSWITGEKAALYTNNSWNGYFKDRAPYHLSHILVKISDSSSSNYYNAKISENDAEKLEKVAKDLRTGELNTFAQVAANNTDDDKSSRGDLGIVGMESAADYINEFKYAVYAYENLYGNVNAVKDSAIEIADDENLATYKDYCYLEDDYNEGRVSAEGFAEIPYGAFDIIKSNASRTKGYKGQSVHDGNEDFFPRNIFFNHYFNRHSLALVTPQKAGDPDAEGYITSLSSGKYAANLGNGEGQNKKGTGFHNFTKAGDGVNFEGTYLATSMQLGDKTVYRPILVVRGGSDGSYQGIHFIAVNRSPFEYVEGSDELKISPLRDYYTTLRPGQDGYPKYQTYVDYHGIEKQYQTRADKVKSTLTSHESEAFKYFVFRKYFASGKLAFNDSKYADNLNKWMTANAQNSVYTFDTDWENSWVKYVANLEQSANTQKKRVPTACAIGFSADHSGDAAWNKIGGACNDGKEHK